MQNTLFSKTEETLDMGLRGDQETAFEPKQHRTLRTITCHDCKDNTELGGYAFRLVPVCSPCRDDEDIRTIHKRADRRANK